MPSEPLSTKERAEIRDWTRVFGPEQAPPSQTILHKRIAFLVSRLLAEHAALIAAVDRLTWESPTLRLQRDHFVAENARLREAAKTGLRYVIAAGHSIPTQPNVVSKDADLIRRALREQE